MVNSTSDLKKEIMDYRLSFQQEEDFILIQDGLGGNQDRLLEYMKRRTGAKSDRVAASMWIRRYAFFLVGHFFALSKYRFLWKGKMENVRVLDDPDDEICAMLTYYLEEDEWIVADEKEVAESFHYILKNFASSILNPLASETKIPKMVMWENIWSYIVWMYSQLLEDPERKERIEQDLSILFDDAVWDGVERKSPFKKLIGNQTISEYMNPFQRKTCCFYYEIDGYDKCPYCPKLGK
ncbi:IucA/IucC family C-terminal-domain containing protein [Bacillus massiliglaciei]|uniref:IucA/IucC family C-terminal-domain containing protein n=1 Tax=Bacillus massiliglaciei TaxID=1816693 RepID=UPI000DA638E3|nr:IucA/IucC family C-terminal-domain containing protein [Bacillus massiliglaciei]